MVIKKKRDLRFLKSFSHKRQTELYIIAKLEPNFQNFFWKIKTFIEKKTTKR